MEGRNGGGKGASSEGNGRGQKGKKQNAKRWVEISVVLVVLAAAVTYQIIHKRAAEAGDGFVKEAVPTLDKQQLVDADSSVPDTAPVVVEKPKIQDKVRDYVEGLSASGLRSYNEHLSMLGDAPQWAALDGFQNTITKDEFVRLLTEVYTLSDDWKRFITIEEDHALITQSVGDPEQPPYKLEFAAEAKTPPRYWRSAAQLGPAPEGKPLDRMVIAIDAGHIGGEQWSLIEGRHLQIDQEPSIREGKMTLDVANLLKPRLESLGAEVVLVRESLDPINPRRPGHYEYDAREHLRGTKTIPTEKGVEQLRNRMFYRVGEIRERAKIVNNIIRPDITICLHFDARFWGDPMDPLMVDESFLHLILHGAYMTGEVAKDAERFSMMEKILAGNHEEETAVSTTVAASMAKATGLPPYIYEAASSRARNIDENPYLWARNLLANRLFKSPVVYLEPYTMNNNYDYARMQMGDYEGEKGLNGKMVKSIFREYADGVAEGLKEHYTQARGILTPAPEPEEVNE